MRCSEIFLILPHLQNGDYVSEITHNLIADWKQVLAKLLLEVEARSLPVQFPGRLTGQVDNKGAVKVLK